MKNLILLLLLLLLIPAFVSAATYTETTGTAATNFNGTTTPSLPAGSLDGKLLVLVSTSSVSSATVSTPPSGYTRLDGLSAQGIAVYGKIGTAIELAPTIIWSSGGSGSQIIAIDSSDGWPAIGSVVAGTDTSTTTPGSGSGYIAYPARTTTTDGNYLFRFAAKLGSSTGSTISSIATTSGYTQVGFYQRSNVSGGMAAAAEGKTVSGNATTDDAAITTWTGAAVHRGITIEFIPDVTTPTLSLSDATPDIDTTVTATLSGAFGAGGNPTTATLSSGDTVACSSATSTTCDFPLNYSALVASGDLGATKMKTALTVTVTNGTETSQSTAINIQVPASGYAIVDLTCTAGTDCSADSEAIVPMVSGDDCAIKVLSGTLDQLSTHCAPVFLTSSFSYIVARFDESAGAWLAQETAVITAPVKGTPKLKIKGVRMGQ